MNKKKLIWLVLVLVALLVAFALMRAKAKKQSETPTPAVSQSVNLAQSLEITATDSVIAKTLSLASGLPISGSLKAYNTAMVKAKVAGEINGLAVREGDVVKVGQLLATIDTTEYVARLNQAQKSADAAKAQIDIAQRAFDNNKALVAQGFISPTALDTSAATLEGAKATYQSAAAAVDVAKKALEDTKVIAPISGQISTKTTQNGERVGPDARILEIVDLSRLELEAPLSGADSAAIRVGQKATLTVEGGKPITASVVRINPSATAGSRAVVAYLQLASSSGLRQGLFAQGTLQTQVVKGIALPIDAVRSDKSAPYVQVIANNKISHIAVIVGDKGEVDGQPYLIVQGLAEGAQVLKGAVGQVREGVSLTEPKPVVAKK